MARTGEFLRFHRSTIRRLSPFSKSHMKTTPTDNLPAPSPGSDRPSAAGGRPAQRREAPRRRPRGVRGPRAQRPARRHRPGRRRRRRDALPPLPDAPGAARGRLPRQRRAALRRRRATRRDRAARRRPRRLAPRLRRDRVAEARPGRRAQRRGPRPRAVRRVPRDDQRDRRRAARQREGRRRDPRGRRPGRPPEDGRRLRRGGRGLARGLRARGAAPVDGDGRAAASTRTSRRGGAAARVGPGVPGPARCGTIGADDRPAPAVHPPPLAAVAATPGHDRPGARRRRHRPARDASRLGPSRGRGRALPPRARVVAPPPPRGDGPRPGRGRRRAAA